MAGEDILGFVILAIVGVVFGTVLAYASRYKKVPPNMAMVVYGRRQKGMGGRGYQVKSGGAKFIVPIFESVEWLRLDVRTLDLGVKRTEEVKRDARMGKAGANREATIAEAQAAQEAERANASAEANVAQFHRDRDIIKQQSETQVELERANKEIAFQLQTAKRQQELIVEQRKIDIRAKEQEVLVQQQEVKRREQEQEAAQVVPAKMAADAVAAT